MAQQWMKAQDTFVAVLDDGTTAFVTKGDTLPATHELVKRDAGSGKLFQPLDTGEDEAPAKSEPAKAEAKAAPVKTAAKPEAGKAS
ncbi:MAG TPA: hypothetical protein VK817_17750 [Trebonia sp.]|jgi:hypothetical protein|nr:hypothetical protein [Trebonia sp.]